MKLFLCEKPSQGRDIASCAGRNKENAGLSNRKRRVRHLGFWLPAGTSQPGRLR